MKSLRQYIKHVLSEAYKVRGYIKPESSFHTLEEWQMIVDVLLEYQDMNIDVRSGSIPEEISPIILKYFGFQLEQEVPRYELLTQVNILNFIEDFINHRFWSLEKQFGSYFPDIRSLKFAYFYSRGDMEPYVLLDKNWTKQFYGSIENTKIVKHWTSVEGLQNLQNSIKSKTLFDISCFTILPANREYFDPNSNILLTLEGNVRAGFRSDIKSFAVDNGMRACNLFRLDYPGGDLTNICHELDSCNETDRTSIWNEYIVTPKKILKIEKI